MLCNNAEYKWMEQDLNTGQLYDVHNKINIYIKHWLVLFICYDTSLFFHVVNDEKRNVFMTSIPARRHFVQTPFVSAGRDPVHHRQDAPRRLPGVRILFVTDDEAKIS
jgi:hypothetical protein